MVISLGYVGWINIAWSGPITFNSAIGLAEDEFILREQFVLNQSGDDPSGSNREREVQALISVLGYAINSDLMFIGVLPYISKELDIRDSGLRQKRSNDGIGDFRLFGRYTLYRRNWSGGTLRISPFAGMEVPFGNDDERDRLGRLPVSLQSGSGSWDPFGGIVLTYQTLDYELDGALSYQENTAANNFEFGDIIRIDTSFQYRLWPKELRSGVPGFLYSVIEANVIFKDKNHMANVHDTNSGGTTLYLAPGIQYVTRRWVVEAAAQIPLIQDLNGTALETDYIVRAGFRFNF